MNRIVTAAAIAVALWGLKRWLDQGRARSPIAQHSPTETWENEGGAVSSRARTQSSEAPR
jgi:hypothetical protein